MRYQNNYPRHTLFKQLNDIASPVSVDQETQIKEFQWMNETPWTKHAGMKHLNQIIWYNDTQDYWEGGVPESTKLTLWISMCSLTRNFVPNIFPHTSQLKFFTFSWTNSMWALRFFSCMCLLHTLHSTICLYKFVCWPFLWPETHKIATSCNIFF